MKKSLSLALCLLLGGCVYPSTKSIEGPSPGINYPYQDSAPLPWVCALPSERAIAMKDVDFELISHQLRFHMGFQAETNPYKDIDLVLIDYTILPEGDCCANKRKTIKYEGKAYSKKYQVPPKRYFMHVSFFKCGHHPPASPVFEETNTLPVSFAPSQEAIRFLLHSILMDHRVSCLKKMNVKF